MKPPQIVREPRLLFFDLEVFAHIAHVWRYYKQNVIKIEKAAMICTIAYQWLHEKQVQTIGLPHFYGHPKGLGVLETYPKNRKLMKAFYPVFNSADVVVAYNGDGFDVPWVLTEYFRMKFPPLKPPVQYDPLKFFRYKLNLPNNRLETVAEALGYGQKIRHSGYPMWDGCMNGRRKEWGEMILYAGHDVVLLKKIYHEAARWDPRHPDLSHFRRDWNCPYCGSSDKRFKAYKYLQGSVKKQFRCQGKRDGRICGKYYLGPTERSPKMHR